MLELEHRFQIVDVHTRLNPATASSTPTAGITPERLERELRQAGIVRTVVFPPSDVDGLLRANNAVARLAVDRPFVPFARLDGPRDPTGTPIAKLRSFTAGRKEVHVSPADVERYAYGDRFYGFKLSPATDGLPHDTVLEELESAGRPVLVHVGEGFPPAALEETLLQWQMPVIVAHFGGYPLNRELMNHAIDLLDRYDECYLDTSVVRYRDMIERGLREHPDRILFGSGTPDIHPNVAVMELLTLDIPEDAMRRAFEKNPKRVIPALTGDQ